jgi:hypothetical protein
LKRKSVYFQPVQTIATFSDGIPAHLAQGRLDEEGIFSYLADEQTVGLAWHLTNAIGGIKLQVADEDAEKARVILAEHGAEPSAEETKDPTTPNDATGSEDDLSFSAREQTADRALRGAIFSIFVFPLQLYVFWLLLKVFVSEEQLRPRHRRHAMIAAVINLPIVVLILFWVKAWMVSF